MFYFIFVSEEERMDIRMDIRTKRDEREEG